MFVMKVCVIGDVDLFATTDGPNNYLVEVGELDKAVRCIEGILVELVVVVYGENGRVENA